MVKSTIFVGGSFFFTLWGYKFDHFRWRVELFSPKCVVSARRGAYFWCKRYKVGARRPRCRQGFAVIDFFCCYWLKLVFLSLSTGFAVIDSIFAVIRGVGLNSHTWPDAN